VEPPCLALDPVSKLLWLIEAIRRMRLTGVAHKDDQPASLAAPDGVTD